VKTKTIYIEDSPIGRRKALEKQSYYAVPVDLEEKVALKMLDFEAKAREYEHFLGMLRVLPNEAVVPSFLEESDAKSDTGEKVQEPVRGRGRPKSKKQQNTT
jgi:hypothetical protein